MSKHTPEPLVHKLLDALEELLAVAPHKPPGAGLIEGIEFRHAEALKRARAAIAKAKGEA